MDICNYKIMKAKVADAQIKKLKIQIEKIKETIINLNRELEWKQTIKNEIISTFTKDEQEFFSK